MAKSICFLCILVSYLAAVGSLQAQAMELRAKAARAMKRAAAFYRGEAARHGGYVYYYSVDLAERWGEGKAGADTIFVQPPGTPTVGRAYLKAFAATGDPWYVEAARETALALVQGQLQSGGWTQVIHFGPAQRLGQYRTRKGGSWNVSSLDDGQTQAALTFLMLTDQALDFKDAAIHEAAGFGLTALLRAQFPCGAWPQVWTGPVAAKPVLKARYPEHDWRTEGRIRNYWDHYTLNDNLAGTVCDTLMTAERVYKDERCRKAIEKLGDFLVLAQLPEPQPGWCQQYNEAMEPMWARKFEPPAVTGWESQDVLETLIRIARHTGKQEYLEPIARALAYFEKSLLSDGRVARYYELRSNKPLYMDARYQLTYDDALAPAHYGWKQAARFKEIAAAYERARRGEAEAAPVTRDLEVEVRRIIAELDERGRWISIYGGERLVGQPPFRPSFRYISSDVFSRNLETLSTFAARR